MSSEYETLRWPTTLGREEIVKRLVDIREAARAGGAQELVQRFEGVESMAGGQIGVAVVGALTWLQDKPEHNALARSLEMVAVNLKNLR